MGAELLRAAFEHVGKKPSDKALESAATKMRLSDREEMLARLGSTELRPRDVVSLIYQRLVSRMSPSRPKTCGHWFG